MIDLKYWLSKEQIKALSKEEAVEFYNVWADYWRYDIGINVMPGAWRIIDKEKKFIPIRHWKEYQDKPIPEKVHQDWKDNGSFVTGIAGIFGLVWHRPDKKGYYFGQVDADNALAIKEILRWKGDIDVAAFAKRTVVEQHADNRERSMHFDVYSKTPLTNKEADVPKDDNDRPSFEVRCIGRMGIMAGSKHRKGHPMMLLSHGAIDVTVEPMTLEDDHLGQYLNSICTKYGLNPYLGNGNEHHRNHTNNKDKKEAYNEHDDGIPLDEELAQMIRRGPPIYDESIEIRNGTRHNTMLKIADSILFRYSDESDLRSLKDWFILINEHCCTPNPLSSGERDQIWNDAVDYVSRKKAEESGRILTVSDTIREKPGNIIVRGSIVSVTSPFKVAYSAKWRCLECNTLTGFSVTDSNNNSGIRPIVYLNDLKPSKCANCGEKYFEFDYDNSVFDDAKIICLQNSGDTATQDLDEQLEVMVCGDYTRDIRAGEALTIHGRTYISTSNNSSSGGSGRKTNRKLITIMVAKFVVYEDRRTFDITDRDIEAFHRFANYKDDDGKNGVIERLVSMFAPNVIGENDKKLGCLRSAVGGVEEHRRGRIHTLFVGDKGLAKSLLMKESTKAVPNSRYITAQSASSKSALGIVDASNDTKTLVYGPIPLSSGSLVGIDELQTWALFEQGSLLSVMEEGEFFLLKYGKNMPIQAHTTIMATMNQQDIVYTNRSSIAKEEITILQPLLDRFDQVYVSLDNRTEEEDRAYADIRIESITKRRPHNYNYLTKYLLYATGIQSLFTAEAKSMLKEFWISLRRERLAGNRTLEGIFRTAEATAKLHLKTLVDADIATEVMESKRLEQLQHSKFINTIEDPRVVAVEAMVEVVRKTSGPIAFDEIVRQVCALFRQVNDWLLGGGTSILMSAHNRRYRELYDRFFQRIKQPGSTIIVTSIKPLVVVWQTSKVVSVDMDTHEENIAAITTATAAGANDANDTYDIYDKNKVPDNSKSVLPKGHKFTESPTCEKKDDLATIRRTDFAISENENLSYMSHMSHRPENGRDNNNTNGLTYEYLEAVNAYRCDWCKGIYYAETKDTNAAHPCNFSGRGSAT